MTRLALPAALVAGGLVLFAISFAWESWFPPGYGWTQEQSRELRQAEQAMVDWQMKLVEAQRRGVVGGGSSRQTDRLAQRYQRIKSQFESVRTAPRRSAERLRRIAVVLMLAGVAARLPVRLRGDGSPG